MTKYKTAATLLTTSVIAATLGAAAPALAAADTQAPVVSRVTPDLSTRSGNWITFNVGYSDNVAVTDVEMQLLDTDGHITQDSFSYEAPFRLILNMNPYPDNTVIQFRVIAHDAAGNASTPKLVSYHVSKTDPTVTLPANLNGRLVRGAFTTTVTAHAANAGTITSVQLWINRKLASTASKAPWTVRYDSSKVNGKLDALLITSDSYGNYRTDAWTMTADNTAPTLKKTAGPGNGAKVKDTVTVTATATDTSGITKVELLAAGKVVAADTSAPYTLKVAAAKLPKSSPIALRATDKAGNTRVVAIGTWKR
ncbi:Ig-like domain-containing protein [Actinoplanes sp. URMC 104]|uniref:Ig-like domain-containing protein n=1 Tax=Actinoplanes sp. URMC 104 TaxID=3423409 RepID=UPI003F1AEFFD